jgi:hypothetical protein
MSRELAEKLLKVFVDTGDMKMSYRELAVISAKEIERLLAQERERFVFGRVPTIEEAIKEICKTLRPLDDDVEVQSPYLRARLKQLIGRAVREGREKAREMVCKSLCYSCELAIRQLDLTKSGSDLAASSREEGKG